MIHFRGGRNNEGNSWGITVEGTPEEFIIFLSLQKSPGTEPQKNDCPSQPKIEKYVPLVTCCGCDGKFPRKELCRGRCPDCRNKKKVTQEDQQNQLENVSVAEDRDSKKISLPEEDAKSDACCNRCQGSLDNPKSDYCADCAEIINPKYMMDHHLLTYASTLIKVKNLKSPADINQKDSRLYKQLVSRNLLSKLDFSKLENPSPNQSKSTVGQCASCGCTSELIEGKCEDCNPKVNHKIETNGKRDFANAVNDELITYAKKIIKEKGIESRSDLQRKDQGLYVTRII